MICKNNKIFIMNYNGRKFFIINFSEIDLVDFSKVMETSKYTVRKSVDETKTFIKFEGDEPDFLNSLNWKDGPYTYDEIKNILSTPEWSGSLS